MTDQRNLIRAAERLLGRSLPFLAGGDGQKILLERDAWRDAFAALLRERDSNRVHECLRNIRGDVDDDMLIERLVEIQGYLRHGPEGDAAYARGFRECREAAVKVCHEREAGFRADAEGNMADAAYLCSEAIAKLEPKGASA